MHVGLIGKIGILCGIVLGCWSCNHEVFVDEFAPEVTRFTLDGNGDTVVVDFPSDKWDVLAVTTASGQYLSGRVYDADGNLVARDRDLALTGLGCLEYDSEYMHCSFVRDEPRSLSVVVGENMHADSARTISVWVGNEYEQHPIGFEISPGERYEADSVLYALEPGSVETVLEPDKVLSFMNLLSHPWETRVVVRSSEKRWGTFRKEATADLGWLASSMVEVPDSVSGGRLVFGGTKVPLIFGPQHIPLDMPDAQKSVTISPMCSAAISTVLEYRRFRAFYTVHATHPRNGRHRTFSGIYSGQAFTGIFYYTKEETEVHPNPGRDEASVVNRYMK